MKRFLLVAPRPPWDSDFAGLSDGESVFVARVGSAAIATVAALAPAEIEPVLHDESLGLLDPDMPADYVGLTANVAQLPRALELARALRSRGRTVVVGGPHVTLDPAAFEGFADVIVTGEFEAIAAEFYADMIAGALKPRYAGGRPDLSASPAPAWELFDNERALLGVAQTSRGCPFECNFCDVIQYVGRVQRHKTNAQVIAEVQKLYDLGYNAIQLADDNFTVYRRRATSLLEALAAWNGREGRGFVTFNTQVSLDIAADDRMLALCAEAGLTTLFIGIESVNEASLAESGKRQNLVADMAERVRNVVRHGMDVTAALIVGFDADTRDIFERQAAFAATLPASNFKISALSAPAATPLYDEMKRAGRLVEPEGGASAIPSAALGTNIVPAQMSREDLQVGTRWLISRLFSPASFVERMEQASRLLPPSPLLTRSHFHDPPQRALSARLFMRMMGDLARRDPAVAGAIARTRTVMRARPEIGFSLQLMLQTWLLGLNGHIRYGTYDPDWAALPAPPFAAVRRSA